MTADRTKNIRALNKFVTKAGLRPDEFGNVRFTACVSYTARGYTDEFVAPVKLVRNGYHDGKVEITETDVLTAERFHLDFLPDHQEYSQSRNVIGLRVKGRSDKLGAYSVLLTVA